VAEKTITFTKFGTSGETQQAAAHGQHNLVYRNDASSIINHHNQHH